MYVGLSTQKNKPRISAGLDRVLGCHAIMRHQGPLCQGPPRSSGL